VTDPRLHLDLTDDVARLTIRRADKLNALDAEMVDALVPLCRQIERAGAFALVLTGEGEKSFCAGGDIAAWSGWSPEDFGRHWVRDGHAAFDTLARLSCPVIAVLNGHCLGGGLELAACADLRIAESHVKIGQPEAGLGIIPGWSGTQRAVRRFGAQVVRRMALMGEVFTADQAQALGLVDEVVAKGEGLAAAERVVERLRARSPRATELTKMMINAAEGEERERIVEALAGTIAAASPDLAKGLAAFRDKRKPNFREEEE
jgi:enoyl-CoA hydratase/carnithine racemase